MFIVFTSRYVTHSCTICCKMSFLSCAVLQVETGVALRARVQLERLRAEKEERAKEQQAKADADAARKRSSSDTSKDVLQQQKEEGDAGGVQGLGYDPDGYGRDDPYRGQDDLERERAAQQAAVAALSPALAPVTSEREQSVSDWSLGAPPAPKARAPPKVVLARGQEEAVEREAGALVIQKPQMPPAVVMRVAPQERAPLPRQSQAPSTPSDDTDPNKGSEHPSKTHPHLLLPGNKRGAVTDIVAAEKVRGEAPSSVSLQWITPRRDDAEGGVDLQKQQQQQHKQKDTLFGRLSSDLPPQDSPSSDVPNGAHAGEGGSKWSQPSTISPRLAAGAGAGMSQHQQWQQQPLPSTKEKESGQTFSNLFGGPGHLAGSVGCTATSSSEGGGSIPHERHWSEAGRGPLHHAPHPPPHPLPREHKRIFDHKTGKMRDVEVSG